MNLKIKSIVDAGSLEKERIVFIATADLDAGQYMVVKSKRTEPSGVSSAIKAPYWFPDRDVKKDDLVVLYTRVGVNNQRKNTDGTTSHFFYRGLSASEFNDPKDAIVLILADDWASHSLGDQQAARASGHR